MQKDQYNYLFVSDMHVAEGYDTRERAYSPREDFLYDEEFFNFLRYMDGHREKNKKRWELVIVGDGFDFLPVEIGAWQKYKSAQMRLADALSEPDGFNRKWALDDFLNAAIVPEKLRHAVLKEYDKKGYIVTAAPSKRDKFDDDESIEVPAWARDIFKGAKGANRKNAPRIKIDPPKNIFQKIERKFKKIRLALDSYFAGGTWTKFEQLLLTEEGAKEKLTIITNGHKRLFEGLAWWISQGHRLVVIAGNHDLELRWPGVQEQFKEILCSSRDQKSTETPDNFKSRIELKYTWFYLKPGVFYAEHGDQYDALNSAPNALAPFEPVWNKEDKDRHVHLPYGSLGVWMMVGRLEDEFPQFEIMGDQAGAIRYFLKKYPFRTIKLLARNVWQYSRIAWSTVLDTTGPSLSVSLWRSIQLAIIGFLFWLRKGLWRDLSVVTHPLRLAFGSLLSALFSGRFPKLNAWIDRFQAPPPPVEYFPANPLRKKLCKWVGLDPDIADKIYACWYPTGEQFREYVEKHAKDMNLDSQTVKELYGTWDKPITLYRLPMFIYLTLFTIVGLVLMVVNFLAQILLWLLNPLGGLLPLVIILLMTNDRLEWFAKVYPAVTSFIDSAKAFLNWDTITEMSNWLIPILGVVGLMFYAGFNELIKLLRQFLNVKFFNYFVDQDDYILEGALGVQRVLEEGLDYFDQPIYYIFGHDHRPAVQRMPEYRGSTGGGGNTDEGNSYGNFQMESPFYYNIGSWLPWFADQDLRRMRTGGLDNEFTFLKIFSEITDAGSINEEKTYKAEFLRWNDAANRPMEQVEIHTRTEKKPARLFGGWVGAGIAIGIILNLLTVKTTINFASLFTYIAIGFVTGFGIQQLLNWVYNKAYGKW